MIYARMSEKKRSPERPRSCMQEFPIQDRLMNRNDLYLFEPLLVFGNNQIHTNTNAGSAECYLGCDGQLGGDQHHYQRDDDMDEIDDSPCQNDLCATEAC